MKFDYDDCFDETELVLSSKEKKLIKSKAKELRKVCYYFKCFDFYTVADCAGDDEECIGCDFTWQQVADKVGAVLPFVKENEQELFERCLYDELLKKIESIIEGVTVSVLDSPLSKDDICEEINEHDDFEQWKVIETFVKFCDRETVCKVYDYMKQHAHDDEDEDDED